MFERTLFNRWFRYVRKKQSVRRGLTSAGPRCISETQVVHGLSLPFHILYEPAFPSGLIHCSVKIDVSQEVFKIDDHKQM